MEELLSKIDREKLSFQYLTNKQIVMSPCMVSGKLLPHQRGRHRTKQKKHSGLAILTMNVVGVQTRSHCQPLSGFNLNNLNA